MARASTPWQRARGRWRRSSGSSRFSFQSIRSASALLELYFDVHARGQVELAQRVDGLLGRLEDVEQTFMSSYFKMLARFFIDVRRAVDGEALYPGRQRNRTGHPAAGAPDGIHDFAHRLIEQAVVVRLQAYAYLVVHLENTAPDSFSAPLHPCSISHDSSVSVSSQSPTSIFSKRRRRRPCGHPRG